jgi:hypothetical protein
MPASRVKILFTSPRSKLTGQAERYEGTCRCCEQWVISRGLPISFSLRDG